MIDQRNLLICVLLVVATALLYAPVREFEFIGIDDQSYVSENPHISDGLTGEAVVWAFTNNHESNWHPLTWLSHAIDLDLYGLDPAGHHINNVVLHIFNAILIFLVFHKMTGRIWRSALLAAFFALHPLRIESVAWVSERKDVLSTFFGLLSLITYVGYAQFASRKHFYLSLIFFCLALLSKSMLVTLPFAFLLLDYWPLARFGPQRKKRRKKKRGSKRRSSDSALATSSPVRSSRRSVGELLKEKTFFFLASAGSCVAVYLAAVAGGATRGGEHVPIAYRIANALISYVRYLGKSLWPQGLAIHYPHPNIPVVGGVPWNAWQISGALLFLLVVTIVVIRFRQRRYLPVGWFWFLGTLVPTIGLLQVGTAAMADRYTYLPGLGVFVILIWGGADLAIRARRRFPRAEMIGVALALIALVTYSTMSWRHLPSWRNSVALFEQALAVSPRDTLAMNNLGNAYIQRGEYEEAIRQYERAVQIAPRHTQAQVSLSQARIDLVRKRMEERGKRKDLEVKEPEKPDVSEQRVEEAPVE
jgi:hypothetical protein